MRWIELVAISSAELTAAPRNETKNTSFSKAVTRGQPRANGTASRNANSTWTPGSATRSSFRSSISSRSCRAFGLSAWPSTAATILVYPAARHARARPRRDPAGPPRQPRPVPEPDRPADPDRAHVRHVLADGVAREGRRRLRPRADARVEHRRLRGARDGDAAWHRARPRRPVPLPAERADRGLPGHPLLRAAVPRDERVLGGEQRVQRERQPARRGAY